jgi:hypothetical protein
MNYYYWKVLIDFIVISVLDKSYVIPEMYVTNAGPHCNSKTLPALTTDIYGRHVILDVLL